MVSISLLYLLIFIFGLAIGSFLNSLIYRLETAESFLTKRSSCPNCKHVLGWLDLIPLVSFLVLKGKCRYCSQKISWQYPLVELATAVLFVSIFCYTFPNFLFSIFYFLFSIFLIIIFVYDLKHYIIPDKIIYPAIAVAFLYRIISNFQWVAGDWHQLIANSFSPILSAFGAGVFFLAIVLISQGKWMGIGDIKLAFLMGLLLGWPNILVALFLAFFLGAIIGIGLILAGKKTLKSEVPFGPFLITGTLTALFWGEKLIDWYFQLVQLV